MDRDPLAHSQFDRLGRASCPPYEDLLAAAARDLGAHDVPGALAQLDDQARLLFGAARDPAREHVSRLAHAAFEELGYRSTAGNDVDELMLPQVVGTRRGHPAMLAAVLAGLGRRAGLATVVAACPTRWYVGAGDATAHYLVEIGRRTTVALPANPLRAEAMCAHAVARELIELLHERLVADGDLDRARCAHALAGSLPPSPQR